MSYEPDGPDYDADRKQAAEWAKSLLANPDWLLLDTETTGLGPDAEIVQIAIISASGEILLDTLVQPQGEIEPGAARVHGITKEHCQSAPSWPEVYQRLKAALAGCKRLIIYNADFDTRLIRQCCERHSLSSAISHAVVECAMLQYSQFVGDWNDYHGNYRWQRLPGAGHSALTDCWATLEIIKEMAREG